MAWEDTQVYQAKKIILTDNNIANKIWTNNKTT